MSKTSLRVLFLNSENLFSPGESFYGSKYSEAEYEKKIGWIANFIVEKNADVIGLTEFGSDAEVCMGDLLAKIKDLAPESNFNHFALGQPSKGSTKIRNAVISQYPITKVKSLVNFPEGFKLDLHRPGSATANPDNWQTVPYTSFNRPVLQATIQLPKHDLHLFVVHLKSKRPSLKSIDGKNIATGSARSAIMRTAEAAALRYYLDDFLPAQYEANPKVPSILVGDFNDEPNSVPLEILREPFDKKVGPASTWSNADKRRLIACARLHMKFSAYDDKLYSYIHNENFSLIDQGFVTQHLVKKFKRMEMYNDHVIRHQMMAEQTTEEAQQWKSQVSDHGAFVVEFSRVL